MQQVEERLSIVESALAEFIIQTNRSLHRLEREMLIFKDEMKDFKDEMKDFKDEMRGFKDEMQEDRRAMNKEWGALANKMGTLVEDIVAPAVRPAVKKYFDEEVIDFGISRNRKSKEKGLRGEFDVIAVTETTVYLVQTKSGPNKDNLLAFKNEQLPRFRKLFPEYKKLKLVPILAALRFEDELIELGTREGIYMLAYREWEYMDILNFEEMKSKQ